MRWGEIEVTSNHTFLEGASHPEELVREAIRLGHAGMALTDTETLGGSVRAHVAAREAGRNAEGHVDRNAEHHADRNAEHRAERSAEHRAERNGFKLAHGVRARLAIGAEAPPLEILLYPSDRASWSLICRLLTRARSGSVAQSESDLQSRDRHRSNDHGFTERDSVHDENHN